MATIKGIVRDVQENVAFRFVAIETQEGWEFSSPETPATAFVNCVPYYGAFGAFLAMAHECGFYGVEAIEIDPYSGDFLECDPEYPF